MIRSSSIHLRRTVALAVFSVSIASAQFSIDAPPSVRAGEGFDVSVAGPLQSNIIIAIVKKDHAPGRGPNYAYFHGKPTAKLRAPDEPGEEYELRLLENHRELLATRPIVVEGVTAELDAPAGVDAGASFPVRWTGPNNAGDTIRLAEPGSAPDSRVAYAHLIGNPVSITAPDKAGEYELRYVTGQAMFILASRKITVGGTSASLQAPAEVEAGSTIGVAWEGPGNSADVINVVKLSDGKRRAWGYPSLGNPIDISAPVEPGDYELRYQTGQSRAILARAALRVTPAATQPGKLVVESGGDGLNGAAVEIILDASGSMLQRMGAERRIEIAKRTLADLTAETIPAGTRFALRVFGKEVGSCRTDLEIAAAPLNAAAVAAKIGAIQAQNNAKTPIGASLEKVPSDLAGARNAVVVLITDGEETCGGDPAAAVAALQKAGVDVRVNIVGFAIDDEGLKETFEEWARLGGGSYFNADDAEGLASALAGAVQPGFEVVDKGGRTVAVGTAGGDAIDLAPGAYTLRAGGASQPVAIEAGKTTTATLD